MEIETYEENEVRLACLDDNNELVRLANELGAKGQTKILSSGDEIRTFPYRKMTLAEKRIYETLFSTHTSFEEFSESVIPLRVMQVAAHARMFPETTCLVVWHNRSMKDPILVGQTERYGADQYILARWGDALESLNVLKKKAIEILSPKLMSSISDIEARLNGWKAAPDSRLENYLNGEGSYSNPQYFE